MESLDPNVERKYREEYSKLPHRNISFQNFVSEHQKKLKEWAEMEKLFEERIQIGKQSCGIELDEKPKADSIQRTVVIDGANVMHCGSVDIDDRNVPETSRCIPDVLALLAMMRYFVMNDFDVIVIISHKYRQSDSTNYCVAIEELLKHNLCTVTHRTNLDDVIALEFASHVNGIVVTSDNYADHRAESGRYASMCQMHWIGIDWKSLNPKDRNSRTLDGKHFVASKKFKFRSDVARLDQDQVKQRLYVDSSDIRYQISKERRDLNWTKERKSEVIALLNRLIVDGITLCPLNTSRILATPIAPKKVIREHRDDDDSDDNW